MECGFTSGRRQVSSCNSETKPLLLVVAADYGGVGSWEVEFVVVAVVPLDDIGRLPMFMFNLENDTMTIRLAHSISPDQDPVTNFCEHDVSDRLTH